MIDQGVNFPHHREDKGRSFMYVEQTNHFSSNLSADGLNRWHAWAVGQDDAELAERALNLLENSQQKNLLELIFQCSPYLSGGLFEDLSFSCSALSEDPDVLLQAELQAIKALAGAQVKPGLRQAKRRVAVLVAIAEITGFWEHVAVTRALSVFADRCMEKVFETAVGPSANSGVAVIALGKWGGEELNYSSDIDFVVTYDSERAGAQETIRQAKVIVQLLNERTQGGYVFRTDLRLRPDAMPLAFSVEAAQKYYEKLGQNWERAAMIKARPVVGDQACVDKFMALLDSWIWRDHLDSDTIQDIHSIKRQINSTLCPENEFYNYNVKLGHGGIREIEFFVQTQQLIFGGQDKGLRSGKTLVALDALERSGEITSHTRQELYESYIFLRTVEHRLQMVGDRQTHTIPEDELSFLNIVKFLGYETKESFHKDLQKYTSCVQKHYAALFQGAPSLAGPGNLVFTGTDDDPETLKTLSHMGFSDPSRITSTIRGWHHGRYQSTSHLRVRQILTELIPLLLEEFSQTFEPDKAFLQFDALLQALSSGELLFTAFQQDHGLITSVAEVMGGAPKLGQHLSAHPELLESIITGEVFNPLLNRAGLEKDLDKFLLDMHKYEDFLNGLRKWSRNKKFQGGIHIFKNITSVRSCSTFFSDLAEVVLIRFIARAEQEFARVHGRFRGGGICMLALGRLGGRELTVGSDLDLVVTYDPPEDDEESHGEKPLAPGPYYIRFTQKILSELSALTKAGVLYNVDLRLRPLGNDGPLATSIKAFEKYQNNEAWTWEHMSLCRARVIYGSQEAKTRMEHILKSVLSRKRNLKKLKSDALDMRQKISAEFGEDDLDMRYCRGGIVDISFIIHVLQLGHAARDEGVLCANSYQALEQLGAARILSVQDTTLLSETLEVVTDIQARQRLGADGFYNDSDVKKRLARCLSGVVQIFNRVMTG